MIEEVKLDSLSEAEAFQSWLMFHYLYPFTRDSLIGFSINRGDLSVPRDSVRFIGREMNEAYKRFKKDA